MEQVKIGLVGAGNIGQRHIMAIDQLAEAELVAFADPSEAAQERPPAALSPVTAMQQKCWRRARPMR